MKSKALDKFLNLAKSLKGKVQSVYLFGSRARGQERPDSDYDLLLIVSEHFTLADKDTLYDYVMDVLLETGHVLSLKIFKEKEFERLVQLHTPFTQNVLKERILVG